VRPKAFAARYRLDESGVLVASRPRSHFDQGPHERPDLPRCCLVNQLWAARTGSSAGLEPGHLYRYRSHNTDSIELTFQINTTEATVKPGLTHRRVSRPCSELAGCAADGA
jgi:hypothetical protein